MADSNESTPLLTQSASNLKPEDHPQHDESIEEIIEPYLRGLTRRQVLQAMLGFLPSFLAAQQTFISIFTDAKPKWHCTELGNAICSAETNICELPQSAWSWDKPAQTSIVSEWLLDCASNSIIEGLPASSLFMGCLLGGFALFFIGDSFGRKKMLFVSCLIMSVASLLTAFSNNVWIYSALRFVSGIGRAMGTCALVLATESVEKKWQGKIGSVGFVVFTLGFLVLPAMAYSVRNYSWRVLYILISIPGIIFCILLQLFAYESPKWLLAQGREEEALAVLKAFAGPNCKDLTWNFPAASSNQNHMLKGNKNKLSFFRILMESGALCRNFFLLMTIAFGMGLVYYGVSLGVGNLGLDIYWGAAFNALLQVVTFVVVYFSVTKLKRRISILGLNVISGVCCILVVCKVKQIEFGLELLSFFCTSTAVSLSMIYTAELFPTCARNSAVAMIWLALILGGVVSPVLTAAGGDNNVLMYGIFGVSAIATGLLILFLPETVGVRNPADLKQTTGAA